MGLPEQVRRGAERANELFSERNGITETVDPAAPVETPVVPEPQTPDPVEPVVTEQLPEPTPEPVAPQKESSENWESKYRTLQGILRAEQGKWTAEKRVFEGRIQALEQAASQTAAPKPATTLPATSQADIDTYGADLMDVIGRKAAEIADQLVAQRLGELKPELERTREQVSNVATHVYKTNEEKFYGELAKAVPDWATVNDDPKWLDWLGEIDPLSGVARQVYLDNAAKQLDHTRTATLFNTFKQLNGQGKPTPAAAPKPALSPSPRTVGTASAPTHREPDTSVSRSEIAAHYRRGSSDQSYRNSAEHKAMEDRINTAMSTGKIVEA